ncbi:hypothetical protein GGI25_001368 [Coemansia spiralis]|uniref:Transcription regulator Rua1 C-terminal domain-containing protein n=2 Tax=Coemansia TaxID=4863 RepID=A0A9W8GD08_9FUNG|nr:hypothetical protein EDC05_001232 [Coemansia umbellata]KAJ2624070.1 hypothetical protein GGI26_001863 [Coemansia sp. RSA 1358]KAJ2679678.1 hypothetical protein GGI25_001368 [Coemansia spiralis]
MELQLWNVLGAVDSQQWALWQALLNDEAAAGLCESNDMDTISPIATLLDPGAEERLRRASIQLGIEAGVLEPEGIVKNGSGLLTANTDPCFGVFDSGCWEKNAAVDVCTMRSAAHLDANSLNDGNSSDFLAITNHADICYDNRFPNAYAQSQMPSDDSVHPSSMETVDIHASIETLNKNNSGKLTILADCEPNIIRGRDDMYTPRWIRGIGKEKEGLCPICHQKGQAVWKRMKCSAYWYHMNYYHGVCSLSGRPFPQPAATRSIMDTSGKQRQQGQCHICKQWVYLDSSRKVNINVPKIFWWKHIQVCIRQSWSGELEHI